MGRKKAPSRGLKNREDDLIAAATDLAEKQLREGTASSQIIAHYLKAGSVKQQLELEQLRQNNLLLEAKTDALKSAAAETELYESVIEALKAYNGEEDEIV